jgi:hypothetical protein
VDRSVEEEREDGREQENDSSRSFLVYEGGLKK